MDTGTVIGIVVGTVLIMTGIMITPGGSVGLFIDAPSMFIVLGGTACALMVNFPLRDLLGAGKVLKFAFLSPREAPGKLIADFRRYADIARRDGILALEKVTQEISDPFLLRGLHLAVDGTDPEVIHTMMRTEMEFMADRHDRGVKIFKQLGAFAPAFGMIGTLIGLVIMMKNLNDPGVNHRDRTRPDASVSK